MSLIQHNELFDFEGHERAVTQAKAGVIEFGKATEQVISRLKKEQDGLTQQIKDYKAVLQSIKTTQPGATDAIKGIGKQVDAAGAKLTELRAVAKGLASVVDINNAMVLEMEAQLKGYQAQLSRLKPAQADYNAQVAAIGARMKEITPLIEQHKNTAREVSTAQEKASDSQKKSARVTAETITQEKELQLIRRGLADVVNLNTASLAHLEAQQKGLVAQLKALNPAQKDYEQEVQRISARYKEITPLVQAYANTLKSSTTSVNAAEGSYRAMQTELGKLRTQLRDMPDAFNRSSGAINKNNKEAVALNARIQQLDGTLKNADKSMGLFHRNVGNYEGALKKFGNGIKGLIGNIGLLIGVGSAFDAFRFIVDANKQFDSLNQSIRLVSGSSFEFSKNQAFLRKTSDDLGLEITGLSTSFKNFYAAATNSGISTEATRDIFLSASQAAANLKLSQEDVNGVFRAFGSIASKGTVQAEELSGEIGERIPGAFAIAARAMGVTTQKLRQMMQNGEVFASEFLPKFAAELQKTFGKTSHVDSLQASMNRFMNTLNRNIQSEGLKNYLGDIIDLATKFIGIGLDSATEEVTNNLIKEQAELNGLVTALLSANDSQETRNLLFNEIRQKYPEFLDFLTSEAASNDQISAALTVVNELYEKKIQLAGQAAAVDEITSKQVSLAAERFKAVSSKTVQQAIKDAGLMEEFRAASFERQGEMAEELAKKLHFGTLAFLPGTDGKALVNELKQVAALSKRFAEQQEDLTRRRAIIEKDQAVERKKAEADLLKTQGIIRVNLDLLDKEKDKTSQTAKELQAKIDLNKGIEKSLKSQLGIKEKADTPTGETDAQIKKREAEQRKLEAAEKKAQAARIAAAKDEQDVLKANYEKKLKYAQDALDDANRKENITNTERLANETAFQETKLELVTSYAGGALEIEQNLGKLGNKAKLIEYQTLLDDQRREFDKYIADRDAKELASMRAKGKIDATDLADLGGKPVKRGGTLFENENKAKYYDNIYQGQIDAENHLFDLKKARRDATFKDEKDHLENLAKIHEEAAKKIGFMDTKAAEEHTKAAASIRKQIELLSAEERIELERKTTEAIFEIGQMAADAAFSIVNNALAAQGEARISQLEKDKEREMEAAGTNADARLAIEKRFDEQIRKQTIRQAKQERTMALFQIGINTAIAVSKALSTSATIYDGYINAAIAGAAGLAQAAIVMAKPLPQFRHGTKYAPKGPAEVGEAGYEIIERRGKMQVVPQRSIVNLEGGEKIYTHQESQKIIERAFHHHEITEIMKNAHLHERMAGSLREGGRNEKIYIMSKAMQGSGSGITEEAITRAVTEAFKHQPQFNTIITERGFDNEMKKRDERIKYLNSRYKT